MQDIGSRATFEQNAPPDIAMGRAAQNLLSPSAEQREQQEAAAAQGVGGSGGSGALGNAGADAIVSAINGMGDKVITRFEAVETRINGVAAGLHDFSQQQTAFNEQQTVANQQQTVANQQQARINKNQDAFNKGLHVFNTQQTQRMRMLEATVTRNQESLTHLRQTYNQTVMDGNENTVTTTTNFRSVRSVVNALQERIKALEARAGGTAAADGAPPPQPPLPQGPSTQDPPPSLQPPPPQATS